MQTQQPAECGLTHQHGPHNYPGSELGPVARQGFCEGSYDPNERPRTYHSDRLGAVTIPEE